MNYRLVSISGLTYDGDYFAVPEELCEKHNLTDTTWEDDEVPEGFVYLSEDADEAERLFALRLHLDEWEKPLSVCRDHWIEVNYRRVRDGSGPVECNERVALLRKALASVKPKINSLGRFLVDERGFDIEAWLNPTLAQVPPRFVKPKDLTIFDLRMIGYDTLKDWFQADCPDLLKVGTHEVVNTLYFLTDPKEDYPRVERYRTMLRQAFMGQHVEDLRDWIVTNDGEYRVMTDVEADEAWDDDLENYIDDCLEIPASVEPYFDRERWKRDARMDGRGHSLGSYDGREYTIDHEDLSETYYIYRTN